MMVRHFDDDHTPAAQNNAACNPKPVDLQCQSWAQGSKKISNLAVPKERLILNLHGLGPVPDRIGSEERKYWCDEARFRSILDSVSTLPQHVSVEFTFDDGNISDATIAMPVLLDRGQTACFFVCAGRIGRPGYLNSSAMRDIISAEMEIGSHGWGHVDWRRADDKTLDTEIDEARKKIADVAGCVIDKVAIPFGSYDRRVLRRLRRSESEIKTVFTSDGGRVRRPGWMLAREPYDTSWDDSTLAELATRPLSIRKLIGRYVKRWR
jgi:peptidoglycan/xylan/chitin deacetylase (PgdA/CDA1 family)